MQRAGRTSGFTLIEMVITVSIFAILVALAVPAMRTWVSNAKVRTVADSLQNGLRLAQTESLRRSRQVVFSLTNSTQPQTSLTAATNGSYWAVDYIPAMTDGSDTNTFIQSGVLTSQGSSVQINGPAEICFNSIGRIVANSSTGVSGGTCALPTTTLPNGTTVAYIYQITLTHADHPLDVEVTMGGQLHLCDPSQTLSSTNTYGC